MLDGSIDLWMDKLVFLVLADLEPTALLNPGGATRPPEVFLTLTWLLRDGSPHTAAPKSDLHQSRSMKIRSLCVLLEHQRKFRTKPRDDACLVTIATSADRS